MPKVVPLPVCVTQVTPTGWRWFCWRCGTSSPNPISRERVVRCLDKHVAKVHGRPGLDPWVPPWSR